MDIILFHSYPFPKQVFLASRAPVSRNEIQAFLSAWCERHPVRTAARERREELPPEGEFGFANQGLSVCV